jgi:hypothetical protein
MMRRYIASLALLILSAANAHAQSWTAPRTWVTGEVVTSTIMNAHVRDNLSVLRAGGFAVTSQATGDLLCSSSATQFARLDGSHAAGQLLLSTGTGACPAFSTTLAGASYTYSDASATLTFSGNTNTGFNFTGTNGGSITTNTGLSIRIDQDSNETTNNLFIWHGIGTTLMRVYESGLVTVNEDTNANMTQGITINQGANNDALMAFKSSSVAHGVTDIEETDTFGRVIKIDGGTGGMAVQGFSEAIMGVLVSGIATTTDTTKATTSTGAVNLNSALKTGTGLTSILSAGANSNLLVVRDSSTTRAIIDVEGDLHLDATSNINVWDAHNDVGLLENFRVLTMGDVPANYKRRFAAHFEEHRDVLASTGVVTLNPNGHHFVSLKGLMGLTIDTIRQQADKVGLMEARFGLVDLENKALRMELSNLKLEMAILRELLKDGTRGSTLALAAER